MSNDLTPPTPKGAGMKTLNFLEALEANKTRRVRIKNDKLSDWVLVNALNDPRSTYSLDTITSQWEAEPEKYEFNGSLSRTNDCFKLNYISDISREIEVQLDKLSASKAKLKFTIELLD
jgi:hypothetical protein